MTVLELKEILEDFEEDTEVYFSYPSGDYWKTIVAEKVQDAELKVVSYSNYHNKYKLDEESEEDEEETNQVLVLSH